MDSEFFDSLLPLKVVSITLNLGVVDKIKQHIRDE
jgi:hypothetical protein